jgi:hypothetical protein
MDTSKQTEEKSEQTTKKSEQTSLDPVLAMAFGAGVTIFLVLCWVVSSYFYKPDIDIIAALDSKENTPATWSLRGRVRLEDSPVKGILVWAVLKDALGNRDSLPTATADSEGAFVIEPFPKTIAGHTVTEVTVYAREPASTSWFSWLKPRPVTGELVLLVGQGSLRRVDFSIWWLIAPAALFVISIVIAFTTTPSEAYWGSIFLAFFLTLLTIIEISYGLRYVHTTGEKNEILSLGYASIFRGRYVKGTESEWLFSLTASHEPASNQMSTAEALSENASAAEGSAPPIARGFGAPLWVLLLAVAGVGLRTIMIIISEIGHLPDFRNPAELRRRTEVLVRHQLFRLFAPLGAVFVYQFLVIAESATQPVAVALVALGAGLTLTTLLEGSFAAAPAVVLQANVSSSRDRTQEKGVIQISTDGQKETKQDVETIAAKPTTGVGTLPTKESTRTQEDIQNGT